MKIDYALQFTMFNTITIFKAIITVNIYVNVMSHDYSYPDMKLLHTQPAHSSNCICIQFDQSGQYFATGSADALMSLWDITDLTCLRTFSRYLIWIHILLFLYRTYCIVVISQISCVEFKP